MTTITIVAIALPLFVGFSIYLFPKLDRYLALGVALLSCGYGLCILLTQLSLQLELLDHFGVTLLIDRLSGYFILTNGLVATAVILYCWQQGKTAFFYTQAIILHGSVNAAFVCNDFISLYVALEVISIAAFLLISYPRSDRSIWVALRYLFIGNTVMLFYLVGVALVYKAHHSFAFSGLRGSPPEAIALIVMALLLKGGIFVSGMWLPLTHSESDTPVSALLSGVVVKTGILPLVRLTLVVPEIDPIIRLFGVATALLGVTYAVFEKDAKRMLAFSTISQLGFILAAPAAGGFYAMSHGLVKSALFLSAGKLPSRNFQELQNRRIHLSVWMPLLIGSFSISGLPLFAGFGAKMLTLKNVLPWQAIPMNLAGVGTAIYFAKFIFLPINRQNRSPGEDTQKKTPLGFWLGIMILFGGLIVGNVVYAEAYTLANIAKSLIAIGVGWLTYFLIVKRWFVKLPRVLEQFEHLIGVMTLMLIALFSMVLLTVMP